MPTSRITAIALLGTLLALAGCGGGSSPVTTAAPDSAPQASVRPVTQTDADIAALLYADTQRTPPGFYQDTTPAVTGYVSTAHLKSSDIGAGTRPYEVCSDDWNQALQWSESTASNGGSYATLTGNSDSALYFEFDRVRDGTPQAYLRQRVFKCAFVNRDAVDLREATGAAGTLNARPLAAADLASLSEYLWQFTTYNNFGNVVLRSHGSSAANTLMQSLFIATLTSGAPSDCDTIQVIEWQHSVDLISGALNRSVNALWRFGARQQVGVVTLCAL